MLNKYLSNVRVGPFTEQKERELLFGDGVDQETYLFTGRIKEVRAEEKAGEKLVELGAARKC